MYKLRPEYSDCNNLLAFSEDERVVPVQRTVALAASANIGIN